MHKHRTPPKKQQYATIGDFPLENGQHISVVNQSLIIKFAPIANAELVVMDDDLGHIIFNKKTVTEAIQKFLSQ